MRERKYDAYRSFILSDLLSLQKVLSVIVAK